MTKTIRSKITPTQVKRIRRWVVEETYSEYLASINARTKRSNVAWVQDIIDGKKEQDKILHQDKKFILVRDKTWRGDCTKDLHLLAFPIRADIRTVRDLTGDDLPLLVYMQCMSLAKIQQQYGIDPSVVKTYIHYDPSTYHFHIHFVLECNYKYRPNDVFHYEFSEVINNLFENPRFYQENVMKRRVF